MRSELRTRFWVSCACAAAATVLFTLTLVNATWIESLTGLEPDGGSGEAEWLLAAVLAGVALAAAGTAGREWRRVRVARLGR